MTTDTSGLITPYGGKLIDLMVSADALQETKQYASSLPHIRVSDRVTCDLELMAVGAFSPLDGFMGKADYQRVLDEMRLADGTFFPMPITLPVDDLDGIAEGQDIVLRDSRFNPLAILSIEEIYEWDKDELAQKAFGTLDPRHPIVSEMQRWGKYNLSGKIKMLQLPPHYDFKALRRTPAETRSILEKLGHENVVAFQTRNPLHRVHEELTKRAMDQVNGALLLHPVVGMTKPGDVDYYVRVRAYKALVENYYDHNRILLSLLPLAMRMGGPREAAWHAIIRRNYGANHIIIGRDHAGPGKDSQGNPFYGPYDAQEIVKDHRDELGMGVIPFVELVYLTEEDRYEEVSKIDDGTPVSRISGTQVREEFLGQGKPLPDWFTRPEVADVLVDAYPPRHRRGVCIWFTGLSGSGKSTTAEILTSKLFEYGRQVTLLDGDIVRTHLSKGLGFSQEDRDTNIRRIGFVAAEIARHGGTVICAAISPYRATRNDVRNMVGEGFTEVFVDTPLEICEDRDTKGLYAKARRGEIKNFTGIDDPYEPPVNPELTLDTVNNSPEENAERIIAHMLEMGYLLPQPELTPVG